MSRIWTAFIFGIIVTLAMNALDMLYHVVTDTAVHLNYVAVKFTIIFATVFLIALVIGRGKTPGIVTSVLGPVAFYFYYSVASPTLDRSMFTIDEAVWYVVVHVIALAIAYLLAQSFVVKQKGGRLPFAILVSLAALPLYWGWLMALVKLGGGLDEDTTKVMTMGAAFLSLAILFVLIYGATWFCKKGHFPGFAAGLVFGIISVITGATVLDAFVRIFVIGIPYVLAHQLKGAA
ncbi:hypothetical protein HY493_03755 [Candidatus Woesearchaeota archaeon]|nr:hypothetical protein [Candidatus Woesearchaeota archaeon]